MSDETKTCRAAEKRSVRPSRPDQIERVIGILAALGFMLAVSYLIA